MDTPAAKRKATIARKKSNKELLTTVRDRYKVMHDADEENRQAAMEDLKFATLPGHQWEERVRVERGDRPCYEFNKIRVSSKRVINDIRANRPQGKVRATEDGDKKTAEIYEGLIRNIWGKSDGDTCVDYAAEYMVNAGMGAWRIKTEYVADDVFDQEILLDPIPNPFNLFCDPAAKDFMHRDAQDWCLVDKIPTKEFESRWPRAERVDWESSEFNDGEDWEEEEETRVVEYWYKEPYQREIVLLETGETVDIEDAPPELQVLKSRIVDANRIMMCIASGDKILEGPTEWAGDFFPFIMVHGEKLIVDGKLHWYGLTRFAKDAQRSYNASRTAITETIAMAPQAKWWATATQAAGLEVQWAEAHKKNFPFMLYNPDAKAPGAPQRMGGADVPVALIQESQLASEEIKAVTGIHDASMGAKSNESSGRAIYARQQQGEIATFNYSDNIAKAIRYTWDLLVNLVPKVYDTERELRILGSDGSDDYVRVNQVIQDAEGMKTVHDLSAGHYDVAITVGPNFSTLRQEAAEMYMSLTQGMPELMGVAGDLIFKSLDLPYAEDIAERLKTLLPPPIQQMIDQDKEIPPEAQAAMQRAEQAMQEVQKVGQMVQAAAQELEQEKGVAEKAKADAQLAMANLATKEAQFETKIAEEMAKLQQVSIDAKGMSGQAEFDRSSMEEAAEIIKTIDQIAATFIAHASKAMEKMHEVERVVVMNPSGPRISRIDSQRIDGKLVAVPVYDDTPQPPPTVTKIKPFPGSVLRDDDQEEAM